MLKRIGTIIFEIREWAHTRLALKIMFATLFGIIGAIGGTIGGAIFGTIFGVADAWIAWLTRQTPAPGRSFQQVPLRKFAPRKTARHPSRRGRQ